MPTEILTEQQATDYINSLSLLEDTSSEELSIQHNNEIIKYADTLLIDRLRNQDGSLRITDIVSAKDSAFKNNRILQNKDTGDLQLIPSNITINIIKNVVNNG